MRGGTASATDYSVDRGQVRNRTVSWHMGKVSSIFSAVRAKDIVQEREYLRDVHRRLMDRSRSTLAVSKQIVDAMILLRAFLLMMQNRDYVRHTSAAPRGRRRDCHAAAGAEGRSLAPGIDLAAGQLATGLIAGRRRPSRRLTAAGWRSGSSRWSRR
jgi:hypothetical protein